jgi:hypothetical protein
MMVGVHTLVPGNFTEDEDEPAYALTSRPKRILQELWLYDVERMPTAVKISSDEDGFRVMFFPLSTYFLRQYAPMKWK